MDADSLVEVVLPSGMSPSLERLCPPSTSCSEADQPDERPKGGNRGCCWALLLVPSCSLLLTAALATLTVGALMAASCTVQSQYEVPCHEVRSAIINSSSMDILLPSSSFTVLSEDTSHVTMSHLSPVNGAEYHVYFLFKPKTNGSCTCLSLAASSIWFQPDDAGAGYCALQHLNALGVFGLTASTSAGPTCNTRALSVCEPAQLPALQSPTSRPPASSSGDLPGSSNGPMIDRTSPPPNPNDVRAYLGLQALQERSRQPTE